MASIELIDNLVNIFNKKINKNNNIINKYENTYKLIENDISTFITNKDKKSEIIEIIKPYFKVTLENGIYTAFIQMIILNYIELNQNNTKILMLRDSYSNSIFNYISKIKQIIENSSNGEKNAEMLQFIDSWKFVTFEESINEIKNIVISQINYAKKSKHLFDNYIKLSWHHNIVLYKLRHYKLKNNKRLYNENMKHFMKNFKECYLMYYDIFNNKNS